MPAAWSATWPSNKLGKQQQMEKGKQQMRGTPGKVEAKSHEAPLGEAHLSEERTLFSKPRDRLRCPQAEKVSEMVWHPEELDADLPLGWCTCIARQALCP